MDEEPQNVYPIITQKRKASQDQPLGVPQFQTPAQKLYVTVRDYTIAELSDFGEAVYTINQ